MLNYPEIFETVRDATKKAGKVRHLGVSAHTDPASILRAAVKTGRYSAAMVAYNVVNHRYVDDAVAEAKKADVGVIGDEGGAPCIRGLLVNPREERTKAFLSKVL